MVAMLRSELFRLDRRAMPKVLLLILAMTVAAIYLLSWGAAQSGQFSEAERVDLLDSLALGNTLDTALGFAGVFGSLFVIILSSSVVATEYGWGTTRALLPRASGRGAYLTAKLLVLAVFGLVVVIVTVAVGYAASAVVTVAEDLDHTVNEKFAADLLLGIGRSRFAMMPYLALAFMIALLARSSAAGISVAAAILFLEGQILSLIAAAGGVLERLPELFLSKNVEALISTTSDAGRADLPSAWQAAAVLPVYTAAFLGVAFWSFHRRDVTVG